MQHSPGIVLIPQIKLPFSPVGTWRYTTSVTSPSQANSYLFTYLLTLQTTSYSSTQNGLSKADLILLLLTVTTTLPNCNCPHSLQDKSKQSFIFAYKICLYNPLIMTSTYGIVPGQHSYWSLSVAGSLQLHAWVFPLTWSSPHLHPGPTPWPIDITCLGKPVPPMASSILTHPCPTLVCK